ncbi:hypothetical protein [Brevibacillus reuszeri]|uniref:hypothetical protein n=1 Tax=Brevibacillus reuszeri TaxID=54915 RepID=UPI003D1C34D2
MSDAASLLPLEEYARTLVEAFTVPGASLVTFLWVWLRHISRRRFNWSFANVAV